MERGSKSHPAMVMWVLSVGLVSQSLVVPVASRSLEGVTEQKAYYPPDPHRSHSPRHSHRTPKCPTPSTPSHGTPTAPSHGGGYWRTHPALIWGIFGYWAPMAGIFQTGGNAAFGPTLNLPQALSNTRMDGIGALYREGTAALLNSMVSRTFHFTTQQVKDAFNSAIVSNNAAAAQARLFRKANEGH
ncbi:Protodermal factor 1 [Acorus calamus]|uniref:Protodermal factor 1 n=1 Tax=Acorus calamus TaxID=4465 RepID=A0AAV9DQS9_ACOCL|nr:Protodermal factor 1 [Acorus calamus]